jgi:small subunit ribosomal protein S12
MAPTLYQLLGKTRKPRHYKNRRRALKGCPQRKATVDKRFIMTPRKPNSALRKVARVKIIYPRKGYTAITAYIPGIRGADKDLQKHSVVLLKICLG